MGVTTMSTIPADLHGFLNPTDHVAISFWIVSIAMVASTCFFLMESTSVGDHWKTSLNVGALVTLIAAVHYFYMREYWVQLQASPIVYRYIDWSLTVPLQMIEFFLILQAVKPDLGSGMFFRLLIGTVVMLPFILFEIFVGPASKVAKDNLSPAVSYSFNLMRAIVSVGWSIYPLGYYFGYLLGQISDAPLNLIYNLADFINKIYFCAAIWSAARTETLARESKEGLLA